jgi:hypothetical protein
VISAVDAGDWEEDASCEFYLENRLTGDAANVDAVDAEIGKVAVRQAVKLCYRVAVGPPVLIALSKVHFRFLSYSEAVRPL